jgi:hypothetical protein
MAYGDDFIITQDAGFYIETTDIGTFIYADPNEFDTENIFKDKTYFLTKEDELKVRKFMDNRLGYDWVEEFQIDSVQWVTNENIRLVEVAHSAICNVLADKIYNSFLEEYKEDRYNKL